jgi:hypothetical protein
MAKSLSSEEINSLIQATKNADRLTRLQVFTLATSGLIDVVDGAFIVTGKGQRALKRQSRQAQQAAVVPVVMEAALEILDTNEAMCNHRAIWDRVGRDKFERDDVLDALRALREEGVLETIKMSGNNFQVFWRRGAAAPAVAAPAAVVEAAEAEVVEA